MDTHTSPDRLAALHLRLLEESDPLKRAGVHLELAAIQMSNGAFDQAGRHFREALHLDGTLEVARQRLTELGAGTAQKRTGLRAFFSRRSG